MREVLEVKDFEPHRIGRRVFDGVLNVAVPEVILNERSCASNSGTNSA